MRTALFIHGTNGTSSNHWFPWLKKELESRGYTVIAPDFPIGPDQNFESWYSTFKSVASKLDRDSIIVAHSMGVPFALKIIERSLLPYEACFFVGGFFEPYNDDEDAKVTASFVSEPFDFAQIRKNCKRFFIYASEDDDVVHVKLSENLADNLNEDPILFDDAGHFTEEDGYTEFEDLLIDILSLDI